MTYKTRHPTENQSKDAQVRDTPRRGRPCRHHRERARWRCGCARRTAGGGRRAPGGPPVQCPARVVVRTLGFGSVSYVHHISHCNGHAASRHVALIVSLTEVLSPVLVLCAPGRRRAGSRPGRCPPLQLMPGPGCQHLRVLQATPGENV